MRLQPPQAQLLAAPWSCITMRAPAPLGEGGLVWGAAAPPHPIRLLLHIQMKDAHKTNNPGYFLKPIAHEEGEKTQLFSSQQSSAPGGQSLPLRGSGAFQLSLITVPSPSFCLCTGSPSPESTAALPDELEHQRNEVHPQGKEQGLTRAEEQPHTPGSSRQGRASSKGSTFPLTSLVGCVENPPACSTPDVFVPLFAVSSLISCWNSGWAMMTCYQNSGWLLMLLEFVSRQLWFW